MATFGWEVAAADASSLFFPTVHVHDGELHSTARFDHALYYQITSDATPAARGPDGAALAARTAYEPIESRVAIGQTRGVAVEGGRVFQCVVHGELPNADVRVALTSPR